MGKTICVYAASSHHLPECYIEAARRLAIELSQHHLAVINGAGHQGLMGAMNDELIRLGAKVTGIIPNFMVQRGWHHPGLKDLVVTTDIHERKWQMAKRSEGVIALPGGCGTLEELLEIITWKQLGLYTHPIVLCNVNHFFDPLLDMLARCIGQHFMQPLHADLWTVADSPAQAVKYVVETPEWNKEISKFAPDE